MKRSFLTGATLAALLCGLQAAPANAALLSATGTCSQIDNDTPADEQGQCSKSMTYDDVTNLLTIQLTNTTPAALGGFITGDAFTLPDNAGPTGFTTTDSDFVFVALANTQQDQPGGAEVAFGSPRNWAFLLDPPGASTPSWEGSGAPNAGVGVGQSVTFTLLLASDLVANGSFSTAFFSEAIRFRGFADGGSDKDLVVCPPNTPDCGGGGSDGGSIVPEPGSMMLLGTGLLGFVGALRRRMKK